MVREGKGREGKGEGQREKMDERREKEEEERKMNKHFWSHSNWQS
jgi:hypothetical protein